MSLADDLESTRVRTTRPCEFAAWLRSLDERDRGAAWEAIARTTGDPLYWSTHKLWERFVKAGYLGSEAVVYKHRAGGCKSCLGERAA